MKTLSLIVCCVASAALPRAQVLHIDPAVHVQSTGATVSYNLLGPANSPFGVFVDLAGGPVDLLGERFYLDLSAATLALSAGLLSPSGTFASSYSLPLLPGLSGLVVYGQAVVIDPTAPNGLFRVSNGESTAFHGSTGAVVADFLNATSQGFTGTFASDVVGHIRGGPVQVRTHSTIDPQGGVLPAAIQSPLIPYGCREQMVFRTQDVGATGEPELLTGVRWKAFPGLPLQFDVHSQFELRAGHTPVVPNYSVDPFSALPIAPLSGLDLTFANNTIPGAVPQVMYSGAYIVDPASLLPGGYMPYPVVAPFRYDGVSSLLLEFRVSPSTATGLNGNVVRIMVQSSPNPYARVAARGTPTAFIVPSQTPVATSSVTAPGDCAMHELELEFTRVETWCLSPWLDTLSTAPDYGAPIVALSLPAGTSVQVVYRGAATATGTSPTGWSSSPDVADGNRFLQFRIVLQASLFTGERPLVDTLVVPFQ